MPVRARVACRFEGCITLVKVGERFCDEHKQTWNNREVRAGGDNTHYGHRWRKLRRIILRAQPICSTPNCNKPATQVDHIIPLREGGGDLIENLQGLCIQCHSRKTGEEGMFRAKRERVGGAKSLEK